jgi:hypothetical protein
MTIILMLMCWFTYKCIMSRKKLKSRHKICFYKI